MRSKTDLIDILRNNLHLYTYPDYEKPIECTAYMVENEKPSVTEELLVSTGLDGSVQYVLDADQGVLCFGNSGPMYWGIDLCANKDTLKEALDQVEQHSLRVDTLICSIPDTPGPFEYKDGALTYDIWHLKLDPMCWVTNELGDIETNIPMQWIDTHKEAICQKVFEHYKQYPNIQYLLKSESSRDHEFMRKRRVEAEVPTWFKKCLKN